MKRRSLLKTIPLAALGLAFGKAAHAVTTPVESANAPKKKLVLTVAHITDVHIRQFEDATSRFEKCLQEIKKLKVDFFLNGGDSIHAADYDNIKREQVVEQWAVWINVKYQSDFRI
ncbi:metallophosphoesterase [Pedobacter sp. NJ-S-72]